MKTPAKPQLFVFPTCLICKQQIHEDSHICKIRESREIHLKKTPKENN